VDGESPSYPELDSFPHAKVTVDLMDSKNSIPTPSGSNDETSYFSTRQEAFATELIERTTTQLANGFKSKEERWDKVQLSHILRGSEWHCANATEFWRFVKRKIMGDNALVFCMR